MELNISQRPENNDASSAPYNRFIDAEWPGCDPDAQWDRGEFDREAMFLAAEWNEATYRHDFEKFATTEHIAKLKKHISWVVERLPSNILEYLLSSDRDTGTRQEDTYHTHFNPVLTACVRAYNLPKSCETRLWKHIFQFIKAKFTRMRKTKANAEKKQATANGKRQIPSLHQPSYNPSGLSGTGRRGSTDMDLESEYFSGIDEATSPSHFGGLSRSVSHNSPRDLLARSYNDRIHRSQYIDGAPPAFLFPPLQPAKPAIDYSDVVLHFTSGEGEDKTTSYACLSFFCAEEGHVSFKDVALDLLFKHARKYHPNVLNPELRLHLPTKPVYHDGLISDAQPLSASGLIALKVDPDTVFIRVTQSKTGSAVRPKRFATPSGLSVVHGDPKRQRLDDELTSAYPPQPEANTQGFEDILIDNATAPHDSTAADSTHDETLDTEMANTDLACVDTEPTSNMTINETSQATRLSSVHRDVSDHPMNSEGNDITRKPFNVPSASTVHQQFQGFNIASASKPTTETGLDPKSLLPDDSEKSLTTKDHSRILKADPLRSKRNEAPPVISVPSTPRNFTLPVRTPSQSPSLGESFRDRTPRPSISQASTGLQYPTAAPNNLISTDDSDILREGDVVDSVEDESDSEWGVAGQVDLTEEELNLRIAEKKEELLAKARTMWPAYTKPDTDAGKLALHFIDHFVDSRLMQNGYSAGDSDFAMLIGMAEDATLQDEEAGEQLKKDSLADAMTLLGKTANTTKAREHITPERVEQCWKFFRRTNFKDYRTPFQFCHLRRHCFPLQVYACYWLLEVGFGAFCALLSDELGLGKTQTMIALLTMFPWFANIWNQYDQSRDDHTRHIVPTTGPALRAKKCPSAVKYDYPVLCPCEDGFPKWLLQILENDLLPKGCCAIYVPPFLMNTSGWIGQIADVINANWNAAPGNLFRYNVFIAYGEDRSTEKNISKRGGSALLHVFKAEQHWHKYFKTDDVTDEGNVKQLSTIIVTSTKSYATKVYKAMRDTAIEYYTKGKGKDIKIPEAKLKTRAFWRVGVSTNDEFHLLKGRMTNGFNDHWLGNEESRNNKPLSKNPHYMDIQYKCSGTPAAKGPKDLQWHSRSSQRKVETREKAHPELDWKKVLSGLMREAQFRFKERYLIAHQTDVNTLSRRLQKNPAAAHFRSTRKLINDTAQNWNKLITPISIRREANSKWPDGSIFVELPPVMFKKIHVEPPKDMEDRDKLLNLSQRAYDYLDIERKSQQMATETAFGAGAVGSSTKVSKHQFNSHVYGSRVIASFPFVMKMNELYDDTTFPRKLTAKGLSDCPTARELVDKHIHELAVSSFRLQYLMELIRIHICMAKERATIDVSHNPPRRGKMVVVSDYPGTIEILVKALRYQIEKNDVRNPDTGDLLQIGEHHAAIHSDIRNKNVDIFQETQRRDEHTGALVSKRGKPVLMYDDHFDILVGAIRTLGHGTTLTRATVIVMFEAPCSPSAEIQTSKRTHRITQTRPCTVYAFLSKEIDIERMVVDATFGRKLLDQASELLATQNPMRNKTFKRVFKGFVNEIPVYGKSEEIYQHEVPPYHCLQMAEEDLCPTLPGRQWAFDCTIPVDDDDFQTEFYDMSFAAESVPALIELFATERMKDQVRRRREQEDARLDDMI